MPDLPSLERTTMHPIHGSAASISNSSVSSGGNGPTALPKHHRYSSRSNSFSSASVVTVKRTGSLSSTSTGARNSAVPMRAQSPGETSLIALRLGRDQTSQDHRRRKSVAVDPTERTIGEPLESLEEWSHAKTSSTGSAGDTARNRASSGAIIPPFSPQKRNAQPIDHSPRASPQKQHYSRPTSRRQQSPTASPDREQRPLNLPELASSLTALPPLHTTPALTDPNDTESPSTIQTIATPSTQSSYGQDYFMPDAASPRSNAKSKKPVMIRNHTAPMSAVNSSRLQPVDMTQDTIAMNRRSDPRNDAARDTAVRERYERQQGAEDEGQVAPKDNTRHRRSRTKEKDKKAMLSKALQKANTAVLLDNAQNFEGALEAYGDACRLLHQVMERSSTVDDKRKLDAIRVTYTNRIEELRQLQLAQPGVSDEKSLPTRPMSDDSLPISPATIVTPTIDSNVKSSPSVETATATTARAAGAPKLSYPEPERDSFFSGTIQAVENSSQFDFDLQKTPVKSDAETESEEPAMQEVEQDTAPLSKAGRVLGAPIYLKDEKNEVAVEEEPDEVLPLKPIRSQTLELPRPDENNYMPAPLSPRRPSSPRKDSDTAPIPQASSPEREKPNDRGIETIDTSGSWLDTIDESTSSPTSSVHSVSSQQGLRRKHLRQGSEDSNPDFDAAFDAAVEAAYNEGLEPDLEGRRKREPEHKKHAQQASIVVPASEIKEILSPTNQFHPTNPLGMTAEDEEEERLLDDLTQDYVQTFNFDLSTKSALPRQSDSSGYSRSTWQSSQQSDRTTAGTSLSTVAEDTLPPTITKSAFAQGMPPASINSMLAEQPPPPSRPPPQAALPTLPSMSQNRMSGVRSRRLSGQNLKQLKIETTTKSESRQRASTIHHSASPFKEGEEAKSALDRDFKFGAALEPTTSTTSNSQDERMLKSPQSLDMLSSVSDDSRPMTAATVTTTDQRSLDDEPTELLTHRPPLFKKNKSSVSLRSEHMVLLASPTAETGPTVMTPMSSTFMPFASKQRGNDNPLTSQRANLPSFTGTAADSLYSGGVYLFDTSLSATTTPGSPPRSPGFPVGLEPCPESFLLRPFWLMRNIALTITHPKGGFLTTRVFVPREVWQTKGVKLKSIEDKIANCDLLTAALGRLAGVDTYDADATMEELQSFEEVMERVQNNLVKKLGSEVGISNLAGLFKDAAPSTGVPNVPGSTDTTAGAEKTKSKESKSSFSWRKLRSKSSGAPISSAGQGNKAAVGTRAPEKDVASMLTVPMTSFVPVERRGHKKDVRNLAFEGPNREYMGSLARLFEGVQVLDQIARQVEDPGLRGTSQTHVGLELSIRHAAEFFGFYVCRFVLADLGILIDKYVKRGTEWVLA